MAAPADLAEFRLLRALRAGQPGAFPSLWNAQIGSVWSVVRAMTASDAEALGWVTTFRVDLAERVASFDTELPLARSVGLALYRHVRGAFPATEPLPEGPLPATEAGLRSLPPGARLPYLVHLFFDVDEAELCRAAEADVRPVLRAVARRMEPGEDTDARLATHAELMRTPPAEALFLPPGNEPPPRRPPVFGWAAAAFLVLVVATTPAIWGLVVRTDWSDLGALHAETLAADALTLGGSPEALVRALFAEGVSSRLAEAPDLSSLGLTLVGARRVSTPEPAVVLVYSGDQRLWTLQHHLRGEPPGGEVVATRATGSGTLRARRVTDAVVVGWTEPGGSLWVLGAAAPAGRVLDVAAGIREMRARAADPSTWTEPPVSKPDRSE